MQEETQSAFDAKEKQQQQEQQRHQAMLIAQQQQRQQQERKQMLIEHLLEQNFVVLHTFQINWTVKKTIEEGENWMSKAVELFRQQQQRQQILIEQLRDQNFDHSGYQIEWAVQRTIDEGEEWMSKAVELVRQRELELVRQQQQKRQQEQYLQLRKQMLNMHLREDYDVKLRPFQIKWTVDKTINEGEDWMSKAVELVRQQQQRTQMLIEQLRKQQNFDESHLYRTVLLVQKTSDEGEDWMSKAVELVRQQRQQHQQHHHQQQQQQQQEDLLNIDRKNEVYGLILKFVESTAYTLKVACPRQHDGHYWSLQELENWLELIPPKVAEAEERRLARMAEAVDLVNVVYPHLEAQLESEGIAASRTLAQHRVSTNSMDPDDFLKTEHLDLNSSHCLIIDIPEQPQYMPKEELYLCVAWETNIQWTANRIRVYQDALEAGMVRYVVFCSSGPFLCKKKMEIMEIHKDIRQVRIARHDFDSWNGPENFYDDVAVLQQFGAMHFSTTLRMNVHQGCAQSEILNLLDSMREEFADGNQNVVSEDGDVAGEDEDVAVNVLSSSVQRLDRLGIFDVHTDHRTGIGVSTAHARLAIRSMIRSMSDRVGSGSEIMKLKARLIGEAGLDANLLKDQRKTTA